MQADRFGLSSQRSLKRTRSPSTFTQVRSLVSNCHAHLPRTWDFFSFSNAFSFIWHLTRNSKSANGPIGTHLESLGRTDVSFPFRSSENGPKSLQKEPKIDE